MRIRFETTIEDVIAFNRFHFANSPTWQRQLWTQSLMVFGILALLFLVMHLSSMGPVLAFDWFEGVLAVVFAVAAIAWAFFIRWYMDWSLARNTRKFLAEGSNRLLFGWREMELVNGRLVLNTELIQSSLDLRAIEKIVRDENYTYVYIASVSAYMIPMNLYPEDEYREFVAELIEAWENRDAPRPVEEADERARLADARIAEKPL